MGKVKQKGKNWKEKRYKNMQEDTLQVLADKK